MDLDLAHELTQTPDLAHRLRRLSFFDGHFRQHVAVIAKRHQLDVSIEPIRLTRAFLAWGEDFTSQRAAAAIDRRDYIVFTAGTLLIRLLEAEPVTVSPGAKPPADEIVAFWPEGYVYTEYCLQVLRAVLEQEFAERPAVTSLAGDLRVWWSFRENVAEDRARALGFFDLFVGSEPNWMLPRAAAQRPAMRRQLRLGNALLTPS